MINIIIYNVCGDCLEYSYYKSNGTYGTEDNTIAIAHGLERYIVDKLGGFGSPVFPVAQTLWLNTIKKAVESITDITIQDKIDLLNSICRNASLKIATVKVFTDCFIPYPRIKLETPVLSIGTDGNISWEPIIDATSYRYIWEPSEESTDIGSLGDENLLDITVTTLRGDRFSPGDIIKVQAIGDGAKYLDSDFAEISYANPVEE